MAVPTLFLLDQPHGLQRSHVGNIVSRSGLHGVRKVLVKSTMKHFPTNFGSLIPLKMTVVLAALALLGLVGSASVFLQPAPSATAASRTTAASVHTASHTPSQSNSVAGMIYEEFGPYGGAALRVATCESGLNPSAYNPTSVGG